MSNGQVSPDWLNANEWTSFPFVVGTAVDTYIVDALFSIPQERARHDLLVTRLVPTGHVDGPLLVAESDGDVLFDESSTLNTRSFGAYEIWDIVGDGAWATLVVDPTKEPAVELDDTDGVAIAQRAITYVEADVVTALAAGSEEVAGPGESASMQEGSNIDFNLEATDSGPVITVSAVYRPEDCTPAVRPPPPVQTINGIEPNARGDIQLKGGGCFSVRVGAFVETSQYELRDRCTGDTNMVTVGPSYELKIQNHCRSCCDCIDYTRLFELIRTTHERLIVVGNWDFKNRQKYRKALNLVQAILDAEIIGSRYEDLGGDPCEE